MKINQVFALTFLFPSLVLATEIEDPKGSLRDFLNQRAPRTFAEAFPKNDQIRVHVFSKNCHFSCPIDHTLGSECASICEILPKDLDFTKTLLEVDVDSATTVVSDDTTEIFLRSDYETHSGSLFLKSIRELDVLLGMSGKLVINDIIPTEFSLQNGTLIPAFQVLAKFYGKDGDIRVEYTVAKNLYGMSEVLFFRLNSEKIFKVKAFSPPQKSSPLTKNRLLENRPTGTEL